MQDPLLSASDGILQTHVTWQDIQEEIYKNLGKEAILGSKRTANQIAEGQGYLSRMCLVEPDWQGNSEGLPRRFLVKIASCLTMKEQSETTSGMSAFQNEEVFKMLVSFIRPFHNAEVTIYKIIEEHGAGRIPIPKVYAQCVKYTQLGVNPGPHGAVYRFQLQTINPSTIDRHGSAIKRILDHTARKGKPLESKMLDLLAATIFASRMFDSENQTKGFLLMEYKDNLVEIDSGDCIEMEQLKEILRYLARFQALTGKISAEEKKVFTKDVFKNLCQGFFQNSRAGLLSDLTSLGDGCFLPYLADLELCFDDLYSDESIQSLDTWNEVNGLPDILTHGDLWIANTLWTKQNGKLKMEAIIDFQTSNLNIMASDLATLVTNLNGDERRAKKDEIIEIFHEYVCEEWEGKPPYSIQQLRRSFDKIFPICAVEVLQGSLPFIESSKISKGEKAAELVKRNFVMLIEDMIACQKMEIERRKAF